MNELEKIAFQQLMIKLNDLRFRCENETLTQGQILNDVKNAIKIGNAIQNNTN